MVDDNFSDVPKLSLDDAGTPLNGSVEAKSLNVGRWLFVVAGVFGVAGVAAIVFAVLVGVGVVQTPAQTAQVNDNVSLESFSGREASQLVAETSEE